MLGDAYPAILIIAMILFVVIDFLAYLFFRKKLKENVILFGFISEFCIIFLIAGLGIKEYAFCYGALYFFLFEIIFGVTNFIYTKKNSSKKIVEKLDKEQEKWK